MNDYLLRFNEIIESENREESLAYIKEILEERKLSVIEVYEQILTPSLNSMQSSGNEEVDIWKEHIRTSIIRTIIENVYPYVIRDRDEKYGVKSGKKIAVICPTDEYHELGARMITDYFTMLGYEATYVGSNTPREVFVSGLKTQKLDYIAISISNPYHLISTRNTIARIREVDNNVKIIVGGNAISKLGEKAEILSADYYLTTFDDIISLAGGHIDETTL
ncbi:B12-binding domain-containing protein [Proteiniclasticum sp. C24MP]|uniref:cobalamin B12-binding domain-containing protein n=1 Tax=Proteiniclasticum sp. C24MP TaxID=3374101 RepID=UPI003754205F